MHIAIITPALHDANNGNWQTAQRWASIFAAHHAVDLALGVGDLPKPLAQYDTLIALHARRSAASITAFAAARPSTPLWVVLTGTDLYRDIAQDKAAQHSLQLASVLVVLQEDGGTALPLAVRHKAHVVFQSSPARSGTACAKHLAKPLATVVQTQPNKKLEINEAAGLVRVDGAKTPINTVSIVVLGHIRAEKSPETTLAIARLLGQKRLAARITHIGKLLDDAFAAEIDAVQRGCPAHYRWLGGLPHGHCLDAIACADVLLHPSIMEGGALAIIEAVQCGKPVILSRVAGHIGLWVAGIV
jgi:glycosyltransferase involved in cell wall biosynthesis